MISREVCCKVLAKAVSTGADYAELFAENTVNHSISMIASKVDAVKDTVIAGAAVRVYKGLRSVMASTVDTSEAGLLRCAESAAEALGQGSACMDIVLRERTFGDIHPVKVVPGFLMDLVGKEEIMTNSYHHQSVKAPGKGVECVAFSDGEIVEAIDVPELPFFRGVQWHPEVKPDEISQALFAQFLDAVKQNTQG